MGERKTTMYRCQLNLFKENVNNMQTYLRGYVHNNEVRFCILLYEYQSHE